MGLGGFFCFSIRIIGQVHLPERVNNGIFPYDLLDVSRLWEVKEL